MALRESERRLQLAQSAAGSVVWEWNMETDRLTVSEHARELFGVDVDSLARTGAEHLRLIHPDDRGRIQEAIRRLLKDDVDIREEIQFVSGTGRPLWLAERARAIRDPHSGRVTRIVGVAHDITDRKLGEIALRESEEKYRVLVEQQSDLVIKVDAEGRITYLSPSVAAFFGGEDVTYQLGKRVFEASDRVESDAMRRAWESLQGPPHFASFEHRAVAAGQVRWLSWNCRGLIGPAGGLEEVVAVGRDVTERRLAEEALYEEKERAQVTLASIGDGVIRTDALGRVDYLNPVAEQLTGWALAEAYGRRIGEVFHLVDAGTRRPLPDPTERCLRDGKAVEPLGDRVLVRGDGAEFAVRDSAAPIRDRSGRTVGSVVVVQDITQLLGLEREMTFLASYDPLTGLLNRRAFERRLERMLQAARDEGRNAALLYLDLDEFKVINDTCGHVAGDELLKQVSALLQWRAPERVVLARLGGDEFGILIEDRTLVDARRIAEGLLREIAGYRFEWQGRSFECGSSIGLVPIVPQSDDLSSVLSAADAACYVAKEAGRNRIHEYQPDDEAVAERYGAMQWIHRIRKAFDEDRFVLYEQEIRPLGGGEPLREIFIRMLDEDGRLVPPVAFIPAAERYHLVPQIDRWVIANALAALHEDSGRETVTLNLSGQSITQESFLDFVNERLQSSGVDPRRVCFEITETAAIANLTRALAFINALRARGCRFVLDDFGSGMSSFAYLKNLPVDFVKIDGEFVRDLVADPIHAALVGSINQIGHVMGLRTIAEAVEDEPALAALRAIGVDYVQGFHVHRPQPLPGFAARVMHAAGKSAVAPG
jgi:diguanylate cyclase (GGDEF)-like protein/PAS domain S-box-containing protein